MGATATPAATANPPQQSPPPASGGASGWEQAAAPPTQAQVANVGNDVQNAVSPTPSAQSDTTVPQEQAPPLVLTPQKPGGLAGIVEGIANVLVGKTQPELATDQNGNTYVKQQGLTRGQQWMRVGEEALRGAGAGWAAGRGRNPGAALNAGVQQGEQIGAQRQQQETDLQGQADKQNAAARQAKLDQFNTVMLKQKMIQNQFDLTHMQHRATQDDLDFEKARIADEEKMGSAFLGTYTGLNSLPDVEKAHPEVIKKFMNTNDVQVIPHIDPTTGQHDGVSIYLRRPGQGDQLLPPGTTFATAKLGDDGHYTLGTAQTSEPMSQNEIDQLNNAAHTKVGQQQTELATLAHTQAQTAAANATASEAPSVIAKNRAQTANSYADANKNNAEATETRSKADQAADPTLVDGIGTGHLAPERMAYLLSRNPALLDAVMKKYPDFDGGRAAQYPQIYKEFTSTKSGTAGSAINAGASALEHLKNLQDLNTMKSHIYGTPAYNAYHNQLDTLAPELAKFYGDATIPAIAALKNTLGATLPGNREAAIRTQVQSMGKKLDNYEQQWRNAKPSASYEAEMPQMTDEAKEARASLDPNYRARLVNQQLPPQQQQAPQGGNGVRPGEPTAKAADGSTLVVRNGQWVKAQAQ